MEKKYIIGIDQSTQGTKALLFDGRDICSAVPTCRTGRSSTKRDGCLMTE